MTEGTVKLETYHYIWSNSDAYIISHSKSADTIKFVDETINNACAYLRKYAGPDLDFSQIDHAVRETLKKKLGKRKRPVDVFFSEALKGRANRYMRKVFIEEISFCVKDKLEGNPVYYSFIDRIITLASKSNRNALRDFGIMTTGSNIGGGNETKPRKPARRRKKSGRCNRALREIFSPVAKPEARIASRDARAAGTAKTHVPSSKRLPRVIETLKLPEFQEVLKIKL